MILIVMSLQPFSDNYCIFLINRLIADYLVIEFVVLIAMLVVWFSAGENRGRGELIPSCQVSFELLPLPLVH